MSKTDLRPDVAAIAARFGLVPTTSRDEREREEAHMHYVGFDNATLLRTNENPHAQMYTNGIIGCNALVMSSPNGTYMAHINVEQLDKASTEQMNFHNTKTIEAFTHAIGEKPREAGIITSDGTVHPGLIRALNTADIHNKVYDDSQFGILVGARFGNRNINSTFNKINTECARNNLLPSELQWGNMRTGLMSKDILDKNYMAPTESSKARENAIREENARRKADNMRDIFTPKSTKPIPEKNYMAPTESSKARESAIREEPANRLKDKGKGR